MRYRTLILLIATAGLLVFAPAGASPTNIPVKVERIKPKKEKLPSLRFLKENRDFFRGRMDVIRLVPHEVDGDVVAMEERFLVYQNMLANLVAARDTLAWEQIQADQRAFLASVTELGDVEAQLDLLEQLLADQETRLWELEEDFLGRQETALIILVRGVSSDDLPKTIHLVDGYGEPVDTELTPEQRQSLVEGGILQIFHDFVEPRAQTWEVSLTGGSWTNENTSFLSFEPARNQLTFLQLDLAAARPDDGAASIRTSAWVHDPPHRNASVDPR